MSRAKRIAKWLLRVGASRPLGARDDGFSTDGAHRHPLAPNRLRRRFAVRTVNTVWAADITACWTREGWCYLAVVLDLALRRIVGWALRRSPSPELAIAALECALPRLPRGAR